MEWERRGASIWQQERNLRADRMLIDEFASWYMLKSVSKGSTCWKGQSGHYLERFFDDSFGSKPVHSAQDHPGGM